MTALCQAPLGRRQKEIMSEPELLRVTRTGDGGQVRGHTQKSPAELGPEGAPVLVLRRNGVCRQLPPSYLKETLTLAR